jgi:hypothetical protein
LIVCKTGCICDEQLTGATTGAAAYIYVAIRGIVCINCYPGNYLRESLEIIDSNTWGHVKIGYEVLSDNLDYYYYCNQPPGSAESCAVVGRVPETDYGNYTGFKITRNRQGPYNVLVQVWSGGVPQFNWPPPGTPALSNNMGGAYGTPNQYVGTDIYLITEMKGDSVNMDSGGDVDWIKNQWQSSDGGYHYQSASGYRYQGYFPPISDGWRVVPEYSTTGGDFWTYCCWD